MSYITGSNAFKVGLFTLWGVQNGGQSVNQALNYRFNNGVPVQLVQWAAPGYSEQSVKDLGLYAQDQWSVRKLTLSLGVRYDHVNGWVPEQERPAGRFTSLLQVARVDDVPNFTDVSPRLGAAYDLFGDGKTALKVTLGRYTGQMGTNLALAANPANTLVQSSTRTWTDTNGNFNPDCDLQSFEANGECGALDNRKFGTVSPVLRYAPDAREGFGHREYNWQTSVAVQHELRPGFGVNVGYFRTWFGNFLAVDNVLVGKEDYNPYCITAPVDARLPGGGGYQICDGLADVKPSKFGQVDNLATLASHFGKRTEVFNGVDATFNARFGQGGLLQGGMSVGRAATQCVGAYPPNVGALPTADVDAPVQFCKIVPPFRPEFKLAGIYPLPFWGLQTSATYQNLPGAPITTDYVTPNAEIKPSLGRDLAQGPKGVATIVLIEPYTRFEDRINQLDLRFSKIVRVGRVKVQGMFDVYNVFNKDTVLQPITRYGKSYLLPASVLGARLFKFGGQFDF